MTTTAKKRLNSLALATETDALLDAVLESSDLKASKQSLGNLAIVKFIKKNHTSTYRRFIKSTTLRSERQSRKTISR